MTTHRRALGARPDTEAFTLIELLVVIMILAILATLSIGQIQQIKLRSEVVRTASNLKQIGTAIFTYAADNSGEFPANRSGTPFTTPIRTYLGETNVGQQTLRSSVFYTAAQKTPYFLGTTNNGYALSYGMNGYIGVTNNSVLTAGTRLSKVRQPSKLAMVMDFESHYIVSTSTATTNRVDSIRARYGGQMVVVFADGHTEILPVDSVFPVNVSVANATTNSFWLGN